MNVSETQNSLFRQMDAANLVAVIQQSADVAQREDAVEALKKARHDQGSVADMEASSESHIIGGGEAKESQRNVRLRSAPSLPESAPQKDPPMGSLGHFIDTVG